MNQADFLGHAKRPVQLVRTDPVLRVGDAPDRDEPLVEPEGRVLKDRADLVAENMFAAFVAAQQLPRLNLTDPLALAMRANDRPAGPFDLNHQLVALVDVREVADGFDQSRGQFGLALGFAFMAPFYRTRRGESSISLP